MPLICVNTYSGDVSQLEVRFPMASLRTTIPVLIMLGGALTGCSGTSGTPSAASPSTCTAAAALSSVIDTEGLAASVHPYVGDASKNAVTDAALGFDQVGALTTKEIDPDALSRTLTIRPDPTCSDPAALKSAITGRAALMFPTIGNLNEVTWTVEGLDEASGSLTRAEAEKTLGTPIPEHPTAEQLKGLVARVDS